MGNSCTKLEIEKANDNTDNNDSRTVAGEEAFANPGNLGEDSQTSGIVEELRKQRLRLSLDVEGEQLPSVNVPKTPKFPVEFKRELKRLQRVSSSVTGQREKTDKSPGSKTQGSKGSSSFTTELNGITTDTTERDLDAQRLNMVTQEESGRQPVCVLPVSYGACSWAGWEPVRELRGGEQCRKENQDSYCIHVPFGARREEALFAVFDGHGANGQMVSELQFVRDHLPYFIDRVYSTLQTESNATELDTVAKNESVISSLDNIARQYSDLFNLVRYRNVVEALYTGVAECSKLLTLSDSKIDTFMSGTTAVAVWIVDSILFCCNIGDSRCILGRKPSSKGRSLFREKFKAIDLSHDQKPIRQDEVDRIVQSGGRVAYWHSGPGPLRVWLAQEWIPGLAMTRSFGDSLLENVGVTAEPEITCIRLTSNDKFCILASDGVWEFLSSQDVVDIIGKLLGKSSAQAAAETLVQEAVKRWQKEEQVVDDTTAIVLWLEYSEDSTNLTGIRQSGMANAAIETSSQEGSKSRFWKILSGSMSSTSGEMTDGPLEYQPIIVTKECALASFHAQNKTSEPF
eukprot:jgi/Galph1/728/GphlegSOOS_G5468.1